MKTIGLIGGMSWESSLAYYRVINERVKERLGSLHSAKSLMISVDFAEIERLQHEGRWEEAGELLGECAQKLEMGGADFVVLCTNTMHKVAEGIQKRISIPFLHIADVTAEKVMADGLGCVGLLGTRFTMEEDFYKGRLESRFGLRVLIPGRDDRDFIHRVIFEELVQGKILAESRGEFRRIMEALQVEGAQGIILGCTEIELLVKPEDSRLPMFPTAAIHAMAAVDYALV